MALWAPRNHVQKTVFCADTTHPGPRRSTGGGAAFVRLTWGNRVPGAALRTSRTRASPSGTARPPLRRCTPSN
eukprot:6499006-Lingulodinium_polyedra.AAC.1